MPGTFAYTPGSGTILTPGSHTLSVTFTPTDTNNYNSATASVSIAVKETPIISWAPPANISYGTPLSATQLNARATVEGINVQGTFAYTPAAGAILNAGTHTLSVTFTPTDQAGYVLSSASVPITVVKATPVLTWAAAGEYRLRHTARCDAVECGRERARNAGLRARLWHDPQRRHPYPLGHVHADRHDELQQRCRVGSSHRRESDTGDLVGHSREHRCGNGARTDATQCHGRESSGWTVVLAGYRSPCCGVGAAQLLSVTFTPTDTDNYNTVTKTVPITVVSVARDAACDGACQDREPDLRNVQGRHRSFGAIAPRVCTECRRVVVLHAHRRQTMPSTTTGFRPT